MSTSTIAMLSTIVNIAFTLAMFGVLIWVILQGRTRARGLAISGVALLVLQRIIGMGLNVALAYWGMSMVLVSTVLQDLLLIAGIVCLVLAFLRTDRIASRLEQQESLSWPGYGIPDQFGGGDGHGQPRPNTGQYPAWQSGWQPPQR